MRSILKFNNLSLCHIYVSWLWALGSYSHLQLFATWNKYRFMNRSFIIWCKWKSKRRDNKNSSNACTNKCHLWISGYKYIIYTKTSVLFMLISELITDYWSINLAIVFLFKFWNRHPNRARKIETKTRLRTILLHRTIWLGIDFDAWADSPFSPLRISHDIKPTHINMNGKLNNWIVTNNIFMI